MIRHKKLLSKTRIMVKFLIQRKQNTFHCYGIYTTHKNTIRPSKSTIASLVFFFCFLFLFNFYWHPKKIGFRVNFSIFLCKMIFWFSGSLVRTNSFLQIAADCKPWKPKLEWKRVWETFISKEHLAIFFCFRE